MQNNFPLKYDFHSDFENPSINLAHIYAADAKDNAIHPGLNIIQISKKDELVFSFKKSGEDVSLFIHQPNKISGHDAGYVFAEAMKLLTTDKDNIAIHFEDESDLQNLEKNKEFVGQQLIFASLKNLLWDKYVHNQ